MTLEDQIFAQTLLLAGPVEEADEVVLQSLCRLAQRQLTGRLRAGLTPEDCRADFAAAAGLYALADFSQLREQREPVSFTAGELTIHRSGTEAAAHCLRTQAEMIMSPYLRDRFTFMGV